MWLTGYISVMPAYITLKPYIKVKLAYMVVKPQHIYGGYTFSFKKADQTYTLQNYRASSTKWSHTHYTFIK